MPNLPAQILQIQFADIDAVEQDLAALNIVEAQQQLNDRGLARAGVADNRERLARLDAEGNIAQHPVFVLWIRAAVIGEPDIAEFDFAARRRQCVRVSRGETIVTGSSSSLKMRSEAAMADCRMLNFSLKILNRPEEALRVLHEGDQHADLQRSGDHAHAADPKEQRDAGHAEKFDGRVEKGERVDRVLVRFHVDAIQFGELLARFALAVEELHHGHAADVFLQERVDARDGRADAAVGVAHVIAEKYVSRIMNGSGESVASASTPFHWIKKTASRQQHTKSLSIATMPEANRSFSASTSVVTRVTSRPTGLRSKKLIGRRCRCSKISLRRSYIVSWPTHCMMRT